MFKRNIIHPMSIHSTYTFIQLMCINEQNYLKSLRIISQKSSFESIFMLAYDVTEREDMHKIFFQVKHE